MNHRELVALALQGQPVPYVPWSFGFTKEALEVLEDHLGTKELDEFLDPHILWLGDGLPLIEGPAGDLVQDIYGVTWDRSVDKDIGVVRGQVLSRPSLEGYQFPELDSLSTLKTMGEKIQETPDLFRCYAIGFSLFERAWSLRGMTELMMDFYDNPEFVKELLRSIADHNIAQIERALRHDIDAVYFGDDWGAQQGLLTGPEMWYQFIYPELKRMYKVVKDAGKRVFIHSCGDVDELFDDLIAIGLDCFNPFQPEVMDTETLMRTYKGRLSFFGGLSTQRTLPYGTPEEVRMESRKLLELGSGGNYIFSPSHAVESDVPLENILAFIDEAKSQEGYTPRS